MCFIFLIQQPASYIIRYCKRHGEMQMICLRSPCIIRAGRDSVRMSLNSDWQSFSYPLSFVHPQWRKYQTRCNLHVYNAENIPLHSDNGSDSRQRWYLAYGKIGCILWAVFFRMEQHWHIICFSKRINRLQYIVWQIKRLMSAKQLDSYNLFSDRAVSSSFNCSL